MCYKTGQFYLLPTEFRQQALHDRDKVIEVAKDPTGRPPPFGGDTGIIDDTVVRRMRMILEGEDIPRYLDQEALDLLREGRDTYRRLDLAHRRIVALGEDQHLLATWAGTIRTTTFALALRSRGFSAAIHDGFLDVEAQGTNETGVLRTLEKLAVEPAPAGEQLVAGIAPLDTEKFHHYLSRDLLIEDAVAGRVSPDAVPEMAAEMLEGTSRLSGP